MGLSIDKVSFEGEDYARFAERLRANLEALVELLARPGFGEGPRSVGAELEMTLVDAAGRPVLANERVIAGAGDPRLTVELDQFNLECNTNPTALEGRPFSFLRAELEDGLARVREAARPAGARPACIGILPTLEPRDLEPSAMTNVPRYRALSLALRRLRRSPFRICIDGIEPLDIRHDDVTYEGANTSLQVHLRVAPRDFSRVYDAAQVITAPVLSASGNSPTFLGRQLWEETRIALFKQSVDIRPEQTEFGRDAPRVSFGANWLHSGALGLFRDTVECFEPILPVTGAEDPLAVVRAGGVPTLAELRLHSSTVWRWNRPVFDPALGGHLRVELRALPSGPTVTDMIANAAFLIGATLAIAGPSVAGAAHSGGLPGEVDSWVERVPFEQIANNFYRAAQHGLSAELTWLAPSGESRVGSAADIVMALLPRARRALTEAGVDADESEHWLGVIQARVESGCTGAQWQRARLVELERFVPRREAVSAMFAEYMRHSESGLPVHRWSRR